jgi:hypothetical protein
MSDTSTVHSLRIENERLRETLRSAFADGIEAAAKACEAQAKAFLSPEYATDQPLSSFSERFACDECAKAIRAMLASLGSTP